MDCCVNFILDHYDEKRLIENLINDKEFRQKNDQRLREFHNNSFKIESYNIQKTRSINYYIKIQDGYQITNENNLESTTMEEKISSGIRTTFETESSELEKKISRMKPSYDSLIVRQLVKELQIYEINKEYAELNMNNFKKNGYFQWHLFHSKFYELKKEFREKLQNEELKKKREELLYLKKLLEFDLSFENHIAHKCISEYVEDDEYDVAAAVTNIAFVLEYWKKWLKVEDKIKELII